MAAPGRLGDTSMALLTDPRTDPRLLKGLKAYGMENNIHLAKAPASEAEAVSFARQCEHSLESMVSQLSIPRVPNVSVTSLSVLGVDCNEIKLNIYRPDDVSSNKPLPAVLYFHGGAMTMLNTFNDLHTFYASSIAQLGFTCVLVDFRNVLPAPTSRPTPEISLNLFPSGLDDCVSTTKYVDLHRNELCISSIILHGDSGGGNLALATALKLHRDEDKQRRVIDGVCVIDPYISGAYGFCRDWKLRNLPSLIECDGYDVSCQASSILSNLYDGGYRVLDSENCRDTPRSPLAWPYWASEKEMVGLPPHIILTAELDPLRDEGKEYLKKLRRAGVRAEGKVRKGMTHSGELLLSQYVPKEFEAILEEMRGWVQRL